MIEKIGHYSMTNPASVYDEEALTALELAGRTAGKVNECVEHFNTLEKETEEHLKKQDASIPVETEKAVQKFVDDGSFDEAISEYMDDIEQRLDNILKEGGDSTPELVDVRLDANGNTHDTAGEAVRAQVNELAHGTCKPNLIDLNALTAGYVQVTGEHHNSHQTGAFESWVYTSDFIPIELNVAYVLSIKHKAQRDGWYAISVYDANKNFLNRDRTYNYTSDKLERKFTFWNDGEAYVRISYRAYTDANIKFEKSQYPTLMETEKAKINLLESYPFQFDGYVVQNGSIYPPTANGVKYTRHIPVTSGEEYTLYNMSAANQWYRVALYLDSGEALMDYSGSDNKVTFTIPENVVSLIVSIRTEIKPLVGLFKTTPVMSPEQQVFENYLSMTSNNSTPTAIAFDDTVKAINHRGYNTEAPENTLKAFRLSAEHGFKYVECDVRFTSDGVPVLLHDETVDRTSNGTGKISELTFAEVRELDFGQGEKIPSFEEFLALCKSLGLHAYVEIKGDVEFEYLKKIAHITRLYGMRKYTTFISFDYYCLGVINGCDRNIRLGHIVNTIDEIDVDTLRDFKSPSNEVFVNMAFSAVNDEVVKLCIENDLPLEVWTVNNASSIVTMNPYISGVASDSVHAGAVLRETTFNGVMSDGIEIIPNEDVNFGKFISFYDSANDLIFYHGEEAGKVLITNEGEGVYWGDPPTGGGDTPDEPDTGGDTPDEPDTGGDTPDGADITFNVADRTYYAVSGMTWDEWVESEYNVDGWQGYDANNPHNTNPPDLHVVRINGDEVYTLMDGDSYVYADMQITANHTYGYTYKTSK